MNQQGIACVKTDMMQWGAITSYVNLFWLMFFSLAVIYSSGLGASTERREIAQQDTDATVGAAQMEALLSIARATDRDVMVVFGADWCDRCVLLNRYMKNSDLRVRIDERFVVMHVDVGYWDEQRRHEAQRGHPTHEGLPAVVIADASEDFASIMSSEELVTFLPDRDQPIYDWMERVLTYAEQTYAAR